jgi:DNA-binding CsgD family transcriptional regulator
MDAFGQRADLAGESPHQPGTLVHTLKGVAPGDARNRDELASELVRALPDVSRALESAASLQRFWTVATDLARTAGGFDRSALYIVRSGRVWPKRFNFGDRRQWEQRSLAFIRSANPTLKDFPFDARLLETNTTEVVRARGRLPASFRSFVDEVQAPEYVSAPLTVGGRPAGFLAVDAYDSSRRLGRDDAERAAALAELVSGALTRRILADQLRRIHHASGAVMNELPVLDETRASGVLSERERDVVRLVERGLTNPEIAEALGISLATVKTHLTRAFRKLGARTRAEAIAIANADR